MERKRWLFTVAALLIIVSLCAVACDSSVSDGTFQNYKVNFYSEGQLYYTLEVNSENFDFSQSMPSAPTKSGEEGSFVFSHWQYEDGTVLTKDNYPQSEANLYAVFTEVSDSFTVTFKDFYGNYLAVDGKYSQVVKEGEAAKAPTAPEVEGYSFTGWDKSFEDVRENLVVNAVYKKNSHTVTFRSFGEIVKTVEVEYGDPLSEIYPDVEAIEGLTFSGWESEDKEVYNTVPDKDLAFDAKWSVDVARGVNLIIESASITYGETADISVSFERYDAIVYTVSWLVNGFAVDNQGKAELQLNKPAGRYTVQAVIKAEYKRLKSSVPSESKILTVEKADLSVSVKEDSIVYGEEYVPQFSYSGFVGDDDENALKTPVSVSTTYVPGADVGEYFVNAYGAESDNYNIAYKSTILKVNKRPLTVKADDAVVVYGESFAPSDYSMQGVFKDDDLGEPVLSCVYPSKEKNAGEYTILFENGFSGEKVKNYQIEYVSGKLTVEKKTAYVSVDRVEDIVYLDPIPSFSYKADGLVNGDGTESLCEITFVSDYEKGAPAGKYTVYAVNHGESANYNVEILTTKDNPVTFTVNGYTVGFEGYVLKDNRYNQEMWSGDAAKFVTGLPDGFTVKGVIAATTNVSGEYVLTGNALTQDFEWITNLVIMNSDGEDCTGSFNVLYDFTLSVGAAEVDLNVQNYVYDYNGLPQGAGVEIVGEGYTAEYLSEEGRYTSDFPTFVKAGEYTVEFRVLNPDGETVVESSYRITINRISNEIDFSGVSEYTYSGTEQTVGGAVALYENASISYIDNTFKDVPENGKLTITAVAAQTENYKETSTTFEVTVNKADYRVEEIPEVSCKAFAEPGKTLKDVDAPEHFRWYDADSTQIYVGEQKVDAYYCADSRNYNEIRTTVTLTGEKTPLSIVAENSTIAYGTEYIPQYSFEKNAQSFDPSTVGLKLSVKADMTTFAVGSSYRVTLSLEENGWYTAEDKSVIVKVPTVLYNGIYYTIEDALKLNQESGSYIIVAYDTSFAASDIAAEMYPDASYYNLSSGENLLVPYSEAHSTSAFDYSAVAGGVTRNSAYATLFIPEGITFTSQGYVFVSAARSVATGQPTGNTIGNYGLLDIASGAEFVSEGTFECLGYTQGEGRVSVKGGSLYEPMIAIGYKGGNITNSINKTVFPINQYTLNNIMTDMFVYSGTNYFAKAAVGASGEEIVSDVKFMGATSSEFIQITDGYVVKSYNSENGVVDFSIYGTVNFNNMSIKLETIFGDQEMSTAGKQVPLPGYFDFTLKSGFTGTVSAGVKLLPGASFIVEEGATLNVNADIFVYSSVEDVTYDKTSDKFEGTFIYDGWQDGGNKMTYPYSAASNYFYNSVAFDFNGTTPAVFAIRGTLNVNNGAKIAGAFVIEDNGVINIDANAIVSNTIKEDFSNYADKILSITVRGRYFTSTASAYFVNANGKGKISAGSTYTADSSL